MRGLSIIIPAYNEEKNILELYSEIREYAEKLEQGEIIDAWEVWFVNDGSDDRTERVILELCEKESRVHIISFRKNYGKAAALQAAFHHVTGDIVFTIDADLQDDPAEFENFIRKLDEGYDLVVGWKKRRLDSKEKRIPSKLFNIITSQMAGFRLHDFDCGFKCFHREVINSLDCMVSCIGISQF